MSEQENKAVGRMAPRVFVAIRFIVFGVGGFLLMLGAWVFFLDRITSSYDRSIWPILLAPMTLVGAVLMLYGVGEWGRRAYLAVFLSIPLSMFLWFLPFYPQEKLAGVLAPAVVVVAAFLLTKRYYSRRNAQPAR